MSALEFYLDYPEGYIKAIKERKLREWWSFWEVREYYLARERGEPTP